MEPEAEEVSYDVQIVLFVVGTLIIFIYIIGITLNSIGLYLVNRAVNGLQPNQRLYLMNFIAAEILMSLAQIWYVIGHILQDRRLQLFAALMQCTLAISWCLCMIFLTLDRLLEIKLNITYHVYVTQKRVTVANVCVWLLALTNALWMILTEALTDVDVIGVVLTFIFPAFECLFLATCAGVYVYIFRRVKQKKREAAVLNVNKLQTAYEQRIAERRRKETRARNFVPFYIILTFLIFSTLPELIAAVFLKGFSWEDIRRTYVMFVATTLFACGYVADALIYLLMYRSLRHMLLKKVFKNKIGVTDSMNEGTLIKNHATSGRRQTTEFKSVY